MQIKPVILGLVTGVAFSLPVFADDVPQRGCAAKLEAISQQIEHAKTAGNTYKVAGLEKAYKEVMTHCNDDKLYAERLAKIQALEAKLVERQNELTQTVKEGRPMDKVSKKQAKVAEVEAELAKAKAKAKEQRIQTIRYSFKQ